MNLRRRSLVVLGLSLAAAGLLDAAEPPTARPSPAQPTLEEQLDALDRVDAELASARQELKTAAVPARRRELQERIEALRADQERLVSGIERIMGPLPPRVQADEPSVAEEQLERQQRHHEAILERDVERRLPAP